MFFPIHQDFEKSDAIKIEGINGSAHKIWNDFMGQTLIYTASFLTGVWGAAHLLATKGVVSGFGDLSTDNKHIITMEWIVEGVALISIAAFISVVTAVQPEALASQAVYIVAIITLIALAIISIFTGFKVSFFPFRLCPLILCTSAALIFFGAWL